MHGKDTSESIMLASSTSSQQTAWTLGHWHREKIVQDEGNTCREQECWAETEWREKPGQRSDPLLCGSQQFSQQESAIE